MIFEKLDEIIWRYIQYYRDIISNGYIVYLTVCVRYRKLLYINYKTILILKTYQLCQPHLPSIIKLPSNLYNRTSKLFVQVKSTNQQLFNINTTPCKHAQPRLAVSIYSKNKYQLQETLRYTRIVSPKNFTHTELQKKNSTNSCAQLNVEGLESKAERNRRTPFFPAAKFRASKRDNLGRRNWLQFLVSFFGIVPHPVQLAARTYGIQHGSTF